MEEVPRIWVLVKNPINNDNKFKVCIMNIWGSSPSKDQLEQCSNLLN